MKGSLQYVAMALAVCLAAVCSHPIDPRHYISTDDTTATTSDMIAHEQREVFVHMFNWKYSEIQKECRYLGLHGIKAIQISPPNEVLTFPSNNPPNPWWQEYQPKSYAIKSRYGSSSDLTALTKECGKWGVDIYADSVINHMGGGDIKLFKDTYPGETYFHYPICAINNYCDHHEVRFCQLEGLNDLATETEAVRAKIAGYLSDLISLGVNGFRFDASKHMWPADLKSIYERLPDNSRGKRPDLFQEVIEGPPCEITPMEYFGTSPKARVTEFHFATEVAAKITNGNLAAAVTFPLGESYGLMTSERAVVFIDNHDTERRDAPITYKDGPDYVIANTFMMAWPYGYPKLMSGFSWINPNAGPPMSGELVADTDCHDPNGNTWTCIHRFRPIAAAALWRAVTSGSSTVDNVFTQGTSVVGYSRSGKGYIIFNTEKGQVTVTVNTGMGPGSYCDTASGDMIVSGCTGKVIRVEQDGTATITVPGYYVSIIHVKSAVKVPSCVDNKSCNKCNASGYREDCGYVGMEAGECQSEGCCWEESDIPNQPWCFYKNQQSSAFLRASHSILSPLRLA